MDNACDIHALYPRHKSAITERNTLCLESTIGRGFTFYEFFGSSPKDTGFVSWSWAAHHRVTVSMTLNVNKMVWDTDVLLNPW